LVAANGDIVLVRSAELHSIVSDPAKLRPSDTPQIAFAGRSNVGKSSLLNALAGRRKLAFTSATPGKTRQILYYLLNDSFLFVDLPGYGYAKVSHKERAGYKTLVERYFERGGNVRGCVLLLDPRRPIGEQEISFVSYLKSRNVEPIVVLTKWDKIGVAHRAPTRADRLREFADEVRNLVCASAKNREGIEDLWKVIERCLNLEP